MEAKGGMMRNYGNRLAVLCILITTSIFSQKTTQHIPFAFTENKGQFTGNEHGRDSIYFKASGAIDVYLLNKGFSYVITERRSIPGNISSDDPDSLKNQAIENKSHRIDVEFVNANGNFKPVAENALTTYSNYYLPQCPKGLTHIKSYQKVTYKNIYSKTDVTFYGSNSVKGGEGMEYDFILQPGANPDDIQLNYTGDDGLRIVNGKLRIKTIFGEMEECIPEAYQLNEDGKKIPIQINYHFKKEHNHIAFALGNYDKNKKLVIDPWVYMAGGGASDVGLAVTNDPDGNAYFAGYYSSPVNSIPMTGSFQATKNGSIDGLIVKIDPSGTLLWSTYFGGSGSEQCKNIIADANGNLFIIGHTTSTDLYITGSIVQSVLKGPDDLFIMKMNTSGIPVWSTYYGGTGTLDQAYGIDCDYNGNNISVTGYTTSADFPYTTSACVTSTSVIYFVSRFNGNGTPLWATSVCGSATSSPMMDIAVDNNGNTYITGKAMSSFVASPGAFQSAPAGTTNGFLRKLDATGTPLWSTYYGGNGIDIIHGITVDPAGNPIIVGYTSSTTLPFTLNGYQTNANGNNDAFIVKWNGSTGQPLWASYYGGNNDDAATDVITTCNGDILVSGTTKSANLFITTATAYQSTFGGTADIFMAKFNADGTDVTYSTFLGGSGNDGYFGASAIREVGISCYNQHVYLTGQTSSANFPVTPMSFQSNFAGVEDVWFAQIDVNDNTLLLSANPASSLFCMGGETDISATGSLYYSWSGAELTSTTGATVSFIPTVAGAYDYTLTSIECFRVSPFTFSITVLPLPTAVVGIPVSVCPGTAANLSASGGIDYEWNPPIGLDFTDKPNVIATLNNPGIQHYTVVVTTNTCKDTAYTSVVVRNPPNLTVSSDLPLCMGDKTVLTAFGGGISYSWQPATDLDNTNSNSVTYIPNNAGNFTYSVTTTDSYNCQTTLPINITVVTGVTADAGNNKTICSGESTSLNGSGGDLYNWLPTNSLTGNSSSDPLASPFITTQYTLSVTTGSCSDTDTVTVKVNALPPITILNNDTTIFKGENVHLNAVGGSTYQWQPSENYDFSVVSDLIVSPQQTTTYTLTGKDSSTGCSNKDYVTITVALPLCGNLYVPNAFSPNSDGQNDILFVENKNCELSVFQFAVFDRWGNKVFESNDIKTGWDGTLNGVKVVPDVFLYCLVYADNSKVKQSKKGNITLLK